MICYNILLNTKYYEKNIILHVHVHLHLLRDPKRNTTMDAVDVIHYVFSTKSWTLKKCEEPWYKMLQGKCHRNCANYGVLAYVHGDNWPTN